MTPAKSSVIRAPTELRSKRLKQTIAKNEAKSQRGEHLGLVQSPGNFKGLIISWCIA